jgi:hypothetical protein
MILPDLILPKLSNQNFAHSGIDSENHCRDPQHFRLYPWSITYNSNSRGFRDTEGHDTVEQLKKSGVSSAKAAIKAKKFITAITGISGAAQVQDLLQTKQQG